MHTLAIIMAVISAAVIAKYSFRLFFDDSSDFWNCVRFSFTPDLFSLFRGEYFEDIAKSFKLSLYLIVIGLGAYLAYAGISAIGG